MNRVYDRTHYLALVDKLYAALPGLALSTDVIVGFPGEDDDDFDDTLGVVERARFDQVFTFIYSVREGTPAARMTDQVPRAVSQERFDRLVEVVHRSALEKNRPYVGTVQQVLVEGSSKRDSSMLAGRTETNKLVHAPLPHGLDARDLAGSFAHVVVESAHTWFLAGQLAGTENP
jgi:tRNA-2-methylthio-N6-dimethylallyladenosine synthase